MSPVSNNYFSAKRLSDACKQLRSNSTILDQQKKDTEIIKV